LARHPDSTFIVRIGFEAELDPTFFWRDPTDDGQVAFDDTSRLHQRA